MTEFLAKVLILTGGKILALGVPLYAILAYSVRDIFTKRRGWIVYPLAMLVLGLTLLIAGLILAGELPNGL